jgi:hypothetical protein
MFTYRAVEDWSGLPSYGWTIERFVLREPPVRMPFRGNRSEAEAEAARLTQLARQMAANGGFPRVPVPVSESPRPRRSAALPGQAGEIERFTNSEP